jgi:lipopolysaccharide/colanic/teichoic acid biosynthesis glycosyltransferase
MYKNGIKRIADFMIALTAIVCLSPLLLVITLFLHFANKGAGAFFVQERPGLHGKIFKMVKYKTMRDAFDQEGNPLPDKDRLTPVGRVVRSLSID